MSATALSGSIDARKLAPGRHDFDVDVCALAAGSRLSFPLTVVAGARPGRRLALIGGVHGDEAEGIHAAIELAGRLRPETMSGAAVIVPIANVAAFAAHRRRSPIDDVDLNRVFPGDPGGSPSQRLAARLFEIVAGNADFVFTLHSWFVTGDAVPHVEIASSGTVMAESEAGAIAAGFDLVRLADWHEGLLPAATSRAGIPSMEAEIGGRGTMQDRWRGRYAEACDGVLMHLGILPGQARGPATAPRRGTRSNVLAPDGGLLIHRSELGAAVAAGECLGVIATHHGVTPKEIRAPFGGMIVARREALDVEAGESVYAIFRDVSPSRAA